MNIKKAAFFDVDGTLSDGYWLLDLIISLQKEGLFPFDVMEAILNRVELYKQGKLDYNEGAKFISSHYGRGLKGIREKDVYEVGSEVFDKYGPKRYFPYARETVKRMKEKGFNVVLITASPVEVMQYIADDLGAELYSLKAETFDGVYTGGLTLDLGNEMMKRECVLEYAEKNGTDLSESAAFGDSLGDFEMLRSVRYAFGLNPDPFLKERIDLIKAGKWDRSYPETLWGYFTLEDKEIPRRIMEIIES